MSPYTHSARRKRHLSVGYGELIRGNANFRNLWLGQIISLLGDWFNLIASAALVAELTRSGFAVGGLFVVRMLAPFLVSPIAGVVADRYNRKHILILTDILRAIIVLGFLWVREPQHVWVLYTLTALQLGISGFFFPTRTAILPDVVSGPELGAANALSSTTWSVMLALGAALGGIVSGTWGIYPAFAIDSVTFVVSAIFVVRIQYEPADHLDASDKTIGSALHEYLDGLRYLVHHLDILVMALHKAVGALFFTSGLQVIQVVIAEDIFPIGEGGGISLGLMFGVAGVGTGIGPIVARRFTGDRVGFLQVAILLGYLLSSIGLLITAPLFNFETVLVGILFRGIGGGMLRSLSRPSVFYRVCLVYPHERRRCGPCRWRPRYFTGFIRSIVVDHCSIGDPRRFMGLVAHDVEIARLLAGTSG
jgi:MFS family permease